MYAENFRKTIPSPEYKIRKATPDDMREIVDVHMASFENFFLTFLGRRFLELMYRELAVEPFNVFLVAVSPQNKVAGFVVGVSDQTSLYRRLAMKRWLAFFLASCRTAFLHPSIIPRLFRAFGSAGEAAEAACPGLLMSVAVAPGTMKKGVGCALVRNFLSEMSLLGVDQICLKTDRDNNDRPNLFYRRLGFSFVREVRTREGRWLNEYLIRTKADGLPAAMDGGKPVDERSSQLNRILMMNESGSRPKPGGRVLK